MSEGPNLVQLLEPLTPESPVAGLFFVHPKTTEPAAFGYLLEVVQEGAHA